MNRLRLDIDAAQEGVVTTLRSDQGLSIAAGELEASLEPLSRDPVLGKLLRRQDVSFAELQRFGHALAKASLPAPVEEALVHAIASTGIQLVLSVSPNVEGLPWELLFMAQSNVGFLAKHPAVRFSRDLAANRKLESSDSFSILVAFADPQTPEYPCLSKAEQEFSAVCRAVSAQSGGKTVVHALPHATPGALARMLARGPFDAFHFIGHGDLRPSGGLLVLEGAEAGQASLMYGEELGKLLGATQVKLVTLSGCLTLGNPAAIGNQLAKAGIGTVVGMQLPVSDAVAAIFARTLYQSLVDGLSIEEAVFDGRTSISGSIQDWGAPILLTAFPSAAVTANRAKFTAAAKGNLPKPVTSFIGRKPEIGRCADLLNTDRCVVLLGSGGIGKTRLSIEVGRSAETRFEHGVWQVLLESISEPHQVFESIGQVFGFRAPSEPLLESKVIDFLADRSILLILDNCEHVIEACRRAASKILQTCPDVRILATSRETLNTGADTVVRVPSLSYPVDIETSHVALLAQALLDKYEAVQLLIARAKNADAGFVVSNANAHAMARIAKRLDGIPLALEIAASRVRSFTPQQIHGRLCQDLAWLDLENPGAVPRHKTLRATIDWSFRLLSEKEKSAFIRFGIFLGGFTLEAAEAVAGFEPLGKDDVLESLVALVDKSLVIAEPFEYQMRYRLLDTCRHYAIEKLDIAGEVAETHNRHLGYMKVFAADAFWGLLRTADQQKRWHAVLSSESDNCMNAIEWALGPGEDAATAANIVNSLFHYWYSTRSFETAAKTIPRILDRLPACAGRERIQMLTLFGVATIFLGDPSGIQFAEEAKSIAIRLHPDLDGTFVNPWLAECAYMIGDYDLAYTVYDALLTHRRANGQGHSSEQIMFGILCVHRGDFETAYRELSDYAAKKDVRGAGYATCHLAHLDSLQGGNRFPQLYAKGLQILAAFNELGAIAEFLPLATAVFLPNRPELAAMVQGFADRLVEESGATPDRLVWAWGAEIKARTSALIPDGYDAALKNGRTAGLDQILLNFNDLR